MAELGQVFDEIAHIVHGDCKTDAFNCCAGSTGSGVFCCCDADDLTVHVEQRSAGITGVDGRIGLDHVLIRAFRIDRAVLGADITHR